MNCGEPLESRRSCCQIESVVAVDERGQMVLPKEIREKAHIQAGDKLALVTWGQAEEVCCLLLIKAENLNASVKQLLDPILKETTK